MELSGILTADELKAKIVDLALNMKSATGESTFSSHLIRSVIAKTYKKISGKVGVRKCLDFENRIYDNYYKLSEIMTRQKKLTVSYNKLPGYKRLPRIYHIAALMVKASGGSVSAKLIEECISAFNEILPLKVGEIEMLGDAIDLALIEYIAIFCARSNVINEKFDSAISDISNEKIDLKNLGYNSYAYAFVNYASGELLRRFDAVSSKNGLSAYKKADNFLSACARYASAVSSAFNTIYSLRIDDEFILKLCPLNCFLEGKDVVYKDCTTATKYVYLRRIAKKAKDKSEIGLASEIVDRAKSEGRDIAYYILPRPLGKFAIVAYILIVVGYTISNCVTVFMYIPEFKWAASIIFLPISLNLVLMFITSVNVRLFSRRYMPRVKLSGFERTMIVYPVLVFDEAEVDDMVDKLLTVSHANSEEIFSYGLLLDLPASSSVLLSEADERIIERAKERFKALGPRFNLFIRRRTKAVGEEKYQGWEKKRGAILELNNLILCGEKDGFEVVEGDSFNVKYVITLDSDTMINCAYELVQIMEHPFNSDKAVVSLNMRTDPSSVRTPFAEIMHDSLGLNNYSNFVADINYDIFGSGNYTGKGIYRVREFTEKVGDIFMENRVLSHDFVEGAIAGCGSSGESALDSYPETFSSYLSRNIRWLRGDYQLLPFLFTRIRDGKGRFIRNPISVIGRMHILNNILLGLIPVSSAIIIALSLFASAPYWLIGVALSLNLFMILGAIRLIFYKPRKMGIELLRQLLTIAALPTVAYNYAKAILLTLYRLIVKKNLLDWKVFAHSKGRVSFVPNFIASVAFIVAAIFNFHVTFVVMACVFAFGIIYAELLGNRMGKKDKISEECKADLRKIAADTWIYFEKQLKPENNFLPFDNFQEENGVGYAPRTSPTDISFMLTSLVCALKMGFLTYENYAFYAEKVLSSIEAADKWKGNLYNWLDNYSLKRLSGYVSSVDSGNLLASLVLVRNVSEGAIKERAQKLIDATDIGAFFDEGRGLLNIGYNSDSKSYDLNHYDMLGSESMLTYLVGIGLHKLKSTCFKNLSSRCVKYKGKSLYSWTGGAFEYLMSGIYFRYCDGGLLRNSAKSVLKANIAYAKNSGLPFWGVSESQYSSFDQVGNYQYKAFGVPEIALSNERRRAVASPYSSLLFLPFSPKKVAANVRVMLRMGLKGEDGLYEAFDKGVIKTYMAHHQGMILAAICNYFYDDVLTRDFASPEMSAASLLITMAEMPSAERKQEYECLKPLERQIVRAEQTSPPTINLLSNGRYSVLIDSVGDGYSFFRGKFVSRGTRGGLKLYLNKNGERVDLQKQTAYFHDGMAEFVYSDSKCEIKQMAAALPYFDGECRRITVKNMTSAPQTLTLESYMEVALNELYADLSHKTFSGMFVETELNRSIGAVTAKRGNLTLAHYFDVEATYQSNRGNFFGRSSGPNFGRVLDPIVSGVVEMKLGPYESKTVRLYNIVCEDADRLMRQVAITKRENFFDKVESAAPTLCKGLGINRRLRLVMSKLIYNSSPDFIGDVPLVLIESNIVTERIKQKLKLLGKMGLWGVRYKLAFIYFGDGLLRERLFETLNQLTGSNCELCLIDKNDFNLVELAKKSATNIDEIDVTIMHRREIKQANPFDSPISPKIDYAYKLGKGGFLSDGTYALELDKFSLPPRPWSNIISNETFGTIITESGGGYTYYKNSRENKLTEWSNDPVLDSASEGVVLFEDGLCWSCAYRPVMVNCRYQVFHGFGFTEFRSYYNGYISRLREFILDETKYYELTIKNEMNFERNLDALFYVFPVIGDFSLKTNRNLKATFDDKLTVINSVNNEQFIMGCNKKVTDYVCHKQSYIDENGNFCKPKGDFGYDFAPAISVHLTVQSYGTAKAVFYLSAGGKIKTDGAELMIRAAKEKYSSLSCISISTGNPALDYLAKWLPYQIMTSRFFGRTGFYQAGGAIGFRDQLQDCLGVLYVDPSLVRSHILECAAHQFEAGDVQHWWHPPRTGVRTLISDDRLFLPLLTAEYIDFTGDENILYERVPYLEDVRLTGKDYYGSPSQTTSTGTLLEHCIKAIKASSKLSNGLVLMGGGDWNDAMNNVGVLGKGTSVWCSMLLYIVVDKFMPYMKNVKPMLLLKEKLKEGINNAWDGEWFTRAYCDDGTVLGSKNSPECNIDLITQSFAVLCGAVSSDRCKLAMLSAATRLVDTENGIIKLLTPPIRKLNAGYIRDYPPGVRENGGQYTHGAVWFIMSLFKMGEADYAYSLLNMINPINHSKTSADVKKYEVEPYVVSADIYSEPAGKGGWSWYTGAAAWMYHVIIRYMLGISFRGDMIKLSPNLPSSLGEVLFTVKKEDFTVYFKIDNSDKEGEWRIFVEGRGYNTNEIKLTPSLDKREITVRRYK